MRRFGAILLSLTVLVACGPKEDGSEAPPLAAEPVSATRRPAEPFGAMDFVQDGEPAIPAWLSNGAIGLRLNPTSGGNQSGEYATRGSFFLANRYQHEGEEKLLGFDNPFRPYVDWGSNPFDEGITGPLKRSIDFRRGVLTSEWTSNSSQVVTETFLDPTKPVVAQSMKIESAPKGNYVCDINLPSESVVEVGRFSKASGSSFLAATEAGMNFLVSVKGVQEARNDAVQFDLADAKPLEIEFSASFDGKPSPTFTETRARAEKHWKSFWETDIEIDGPEEDQQAVRSFLFYVRNSIQPMGSQAVSPLMLSGSQYNGHVFWDADVWVFPALALVDPERAKTISNYRIRMKSAAEQNFKLRRSWVRNAPSEAKVKGIAALQYPWESSYTGLEVSPTETKQQHHITGDVAWALNLSAALGLVDPNVADDIGRKAAKFYQFRASTIEREKTEGSHYDFRSFRSILDTVSPDENYFGDHDLYTNALAAWTIKRFDPSDKGREFFLPRDGATFLNYGGDRLRGYKQAAGALAIFPLQNPKVEAEAGKFMDRFVDKVTKNGPAMSDSVHATIWARLGESEKAYAAWQDSWKPFTNNPLMLFSEKRSKDVTYFVTGAAGCLQTVIYGFLGIRIDTKAQPGAQWSTQLKQGLVLSIKPNLPKQWKRVRFKGMKVLGKSYDVVVENGIVRVTATK